MGPRPFGRGVSSPTVGGARRLRLQWGRGRSAAESYVNVYNHLGQPQASMGPRPFGRGGPPLVGRDSFGREASMGPRPFGRGVHIRQRLYWVAESASMGPRPFGRGVAK